MSSQIRGILFDLDGVFYVGDRLIEGAIETIQYLRERKIPHRFLTNTTTKSRFALSLKLQAMGLFVEPHEIISSPYAACLYLRRRNLRGCYFVVSEKVKEEFAEFAVSESKPDAVVIGDIGNAWNYDLVNQIFHMVREGAELIALHKCKFWQTASGLQIDIGAFIAGIEYAAGVKATVIGKPSQAFFDLAIKELNCPKETVMMIGDDIDFDTGGAQQSGIRGALVRTGKYRREYAEASSIVPDIVFDSIADLVPLLESTE